MRHLKSHTEVPVISDTDYDFTAHCLYLKSLCLMTTATSITLSNEIKPPEIPFGR